MVNDIAANRLEWSIWKHTHLLLTFMPLDSLSQLETIQETFDVHLDGTKIYILTILVPY